MLHVLYVEYGTVLLKYMPIPFGSRQCLTSSYLHLAQVLVRWFVGSLVLLIVKVKYLGT